MWQTKGTKTCVQWAAGLGTSHQAPKRWWQSIRHMPCQTHLRPFRNDALPSLRRWRSQVRGVSALRGDTPWEALMTYILFPSQNPFLFLPSFTSFLLLPSTVSPPPLVFPLPLSVSLFSSSKKHLSHSHRYSFEIVASQLQGYRFRCKKVGLMYLRWKKRKKHKE